MSDFKENLAKAFGKESIHKKVYLRKKEDSRFRNIGLPK